MPAINKKQVIAIMLTNGTVTATSCTVNGGAAVTKTALSVAASTITTPAILAGLFGAGCQLADAANIESVSNIATYSTNRLIIARLKAVPVANTLAFNMTRSSVVSGAVLDVTAFADDGLTSDAEMSALTTFMSALNTAMA